MRKNEDWQSYLLDTIKLVRKNANFLYRCWECETYTPCSHTDTMILSGWQLGPTPHTGYPCIPLFNSRLFLNPYSFGFFSCWPNYSVIKRKNYDNLNFWDRTLFLRIYGCFEKIRCVPWKPKVSKVLFHGLAVF